MTDILGYGYSAIILIGGAIGYIKAGSVMSLLSGTAFSVAAGVGAHKVSTDPKDVIFSLVVSAVLLFVMGSRFIQSGKFMPAGLVTLLSLSMAIRYGSRLAL